MYYYIKQGQHDDLQFLKNFTKANNITINKMADAFNISRVAVNHWFKVGDILLSRLFIIAEMANCQFSYSLVPLGKPINSSSFEFSADSRLMLPVMHAIWNSNLTIPKLSQKMKIKTNTFRYWTRVDDLYFSKLRQIAQALNCSLVFNFTKQNNLIETVDEPLFVCNFSLKQECYDLLDDIPRSDC